MEDNHQLEANVFAAQNAVEYLNEIGIYDLRKLGEERFKEFINIITKNYHEKICELEEIDVDIPF